MARYVHDGLSELIRPCCLTFTQFLQLNEHKKALDILIDELEDYKAAELYCLYAGRTVSSISKKDKKYLEDKSLIETRKKLFLLLLELYLQMKDR